MAKAKQVKTAVQTALNVENTEPVSIRDAGSKAARAGDSLETVARWCHAHMAGFPNEVSKEDRAAFKDGVFVYYQTVKPPLYFKREGKNLVKLGEAPEKFLPEHVTLDVAFATGITGQQLGGLKTVDPALYEEVSAYRDDCNKYASNRWTAVTGCWRRLSATPKERGANKTFHERMTKVFDTMGKSAVTARVSRKDETAPSAEQFKAAVKAFWAALAS